MNPPPLPEPPDHAVKNALRVQAAAVAAQQAALTEEEARLDQQRATLQNKETQLAAHLDEKQARLRQMTEQAQAAREALAREREAYQKQVARIAEDLRKSKRDVLAGQHHVKKERERLATLRRRLQARCQREWRVQEQALRRREVALDVGHRQQDAAQEILQREQGDLENSRLRFNGEVEIAQRQLADQQNQWHARRAAEQADDEQRRQQLVTREAALAETERLREEEERRGEQRRAGLLQEVAGLENRIANLRQALQHQQAARRDQEAGAAVYVEALSSLPLTNEPAGLSRRDTLDGSNEHVNLDRLAEDLADQRLRLIDYWKGLLESKHCLEQDRARAVGDLKELAAEFSHREGALSLREQSLRVTATEVAQLRRSVEAWVSRFRVRELAWESERDRLLAEVRGREETVEQQLAALAELRQTWAKRRRQELDLLHSEREACAKMRRECAALRQEWGERSRALEKEQRALVEKSLALEQTRQDFILGTADPAGTERRIDKKRQHLEAHYAADLATLNEQRRAFKLESTQLQMRHATLHHLAAELAVREADLAKLQAVWEQNQALHQIDHAKVQQEIHVHRLQCDRSELQITQLQEEVDRLAHLLMEEPEAPIMEAA